MVKVKEFLVQLSIMFFLVLPIILLLEISENTIHWYDYVIMCFVATILSNWIVEKVK